MVVWYGSAVNPICLNSMTTIIFIMKSIRLSGSTRDYLKRYDNQSFDKIIRGLVDETCDDMPKVCFDDTKSSPVNISEETYELLSSLAISSSESVDSIIMRMLIIVGGVDYED